MFFLSVCSSIGNGFMCGIHSTGQIAKSQGINTSTCRLAGVRRLLGRHLKYFSVFNSVDKKQIYCKHVY